MSVEEPVAEEELAAAEEEEAAEAAECRTRVSKRKRAKRNGDGATGTATNSDCRELFALPDSLQDSHSAAHKNKQW